MNEKIEPTMGGPDESPDFLAAPSKRGKGVRRLNHVPLVIVGALVVLAVLAITYTFFQRQAGPRGVATSPLDAGNVTTPATVPINPGRIGPPPMPPEPADEPIVPAIEGQPAPQDVAAAPPPPDPELEARYQLIQRIREKRITDLDAALNADPMVQTFAARRDGEQGQPGATGQTPAQLAGLAGAAQVLASAGMGEGAGLGIGGLGGIGGSPQNEYAAANAQDQKRAFLSQSPELETYLRHTRTPPLSTMEIKAGTFIPGVMISGVNSDLPGQIIGQVRENVYDTATGQYLLIPAGARLIGTYDSAVTMGQERVLVAWRRIIYPDGSSVSLDLMPGADTSGYAGFHDKVNNHYWRIFGNALMLSAFSAGIQLSQPQTNASTYGGLDSQQILTQELGRQLGQLGMEMARRNMNIQPTLEIRPGYRFVVMVTKDIVLPPWQGHPLAAGQR